MPGMNRRVAACGGDVVQPLLVGKTGSKGEDEKWDPREQYALPETRVDCHTALHLHDG
jgi:hypothetical protein